MNTKNSFITVNRVSEKMTEATEKSILTAYKSAQKEIKSQLADLYQKYENDGVLNYADMAKYHRLDGMLKNVDKTVVNTSVNAGNSIKKLSSEVYKEAFYKTAYTIEQAAETKLSFSMLNKKAIQASVENPISGLKLSETLIKNRKQIITAIKQNITQGLVLGESYKKMADRLTTVLNNDATKSMRVVRTEAHRNLNQATLEATEHAAKRGIKLKKEWIATQDDRTRDTHASMDGQIVDWDADFVSPSGSRGPAPGMFGDPAEDINCRCTIGTIIEGAEDVSERSTYADWAKEKGVAVSEDITKMYNQVARAVSKENDISAYIKNTATSLKDISENDSLWKYIDKNGNLSPERELLHQNILNKVFEGVTPQAGQATFSMMGGGPAAGKSTILSSGKVSLPKNNVLVDSDEIKKLLPEYTELVNAGKINDVAFYVHEESSALAKRALEIATKSNYNYTLDGTGDGSVNSMIKKITQAREAGYNVTGYYVTCPTETAVERAVARAMDTGRMVRKEVIKETHKKVSQILPDIASMFDKVELYDSTSNLTLIATGGGGKALTAVKGQEQLLKVFLEKAME